MPAPATLKELGQCSFVPLGVPVDPALERERFLAAFPALLSARTLCEANDDRAAEIAGSLIDQGASPEEMLDPFTDAVTHLQGAIALLEAGHARMIAGMSRACAPHLA